MVHQEATWFQQPVDLAEVLREVRDADMLEHANARDLVVRLALFYPAIIEQTHLTSVLQPELINLRGYIVVLVLTERDANRFDGITLCSPDDQCAPAAP